MNASPYLNFNGNCREAFEFYAQCLGAELTLLTAGETPICDQMPPGWADKIMHGHIQLGDLNIMGSDTPPEMFQPAGGFSVALQIASVERAYSLFAGLSEGGQITMPIGETFWSRAFGCFVDRFGTPWMINGPEPEGVQGC